MDGRPTWTDCDEAGDYVVPNVLSPRDLVFRPDSIDETVPHTLPYQMILIYRFCLLKVKIEMSDKNVYLHGLLHQHPEVHLR